MKDNVNNNTELLNEIISGLHEEPKRLPSKLFYDEKGSELFNKICDLEEYYLTRSEINIMESNAAEIAAYAGEKILLIEFGSGSSVKTRILLDNLNSLAGYIPVDISGVHLISSAEKIKTEYKEIKIYPLEADFTSDFELPLTDNDYTRKVVYFPGSTIGNFDPEQAVKILNRIAAICNPGGALLIGIDLQKDKRIIERAYNDSLGVTAEFNLNILDSINKETGSCFNTSDFYHKAVFNPDESRIEMHLVSKKNQKVYIGDSVIQFRKDEVIVTEYSYKYTIKSFSELAEGIFNIKKYWTDINKYFAVLYLETVTK